MNADELLDLFHARSGIIGAIGAGGKKTILYHLLRVHPGRTAFAATVFTRIFPDSLGLTPIIADEHTVLDQLSLVTEDTKLGLAAPSEKPGRYGGLPPALISRIHRERRLDATFVKADGARTRLIKAPKADEPVLPDDCTTVICVLSARAIGQPLSERIGHRIELISRVAGLASGDSVEPVHLARLFCSDKGLLDGVAQRTVVPVINMVDDPEREGLAREAAELALAMTQRFDRVLLTCLQDPSEPVVAVVERS